MTEVVTIDSLTSSAVVDLFASGDFANRKFAFAVADPKETARRIAQRDLSATSLDELLGGGDSEVISLRDYVNKPFTITGVEWQQSDIEGDGLPFYAVCHIITLDGEIKVATTGAATVVRKLAVIGANNWFPAKVQIKKAPKTAAGYEPLDLVKADF
jgi:hypothetical protein